MNKRFKVLELLHMETNKIYYEVIEDDDFKLPRIGLYRKLEDAEKRAERENLKYKDK